MRTICLILLLVGLPAAGVSQESQSSLQRIVPLPDAPSLQAAVRYGPQEKEPPGVVDRLLRAAGGAAVGAWVGYMASQVAVGDWEDDPRIDRRSWAASGAAVGITLGLTVPGGSRPPGRVAPERTERAPGRDVLTAEQLEKARSGNLYSVIRSLRPEWLRTRGTGSMRETTRGSASGIGGDIEIEQPGIPSIRVYFDDSHLGDLDSLRSVDPGTVGEVRFLSAAEATQRWGAGHLHGAILILTASAP